MDRVNQDLQPVHERVRLTDAASDNVDRVEVPASPTGPPLSEDQIQDNDQYFLQTNLRAADQAARDRATIEQSRNLVQQQLNRLSLQYLQNPTPQLQQQIDQMGRAVAGAREREARLVQEEEDYRRRAEYLEDKIELRNQPPAPQPPAQDRSPRHDPLRDYIR